MPELIALLRARGQRPCRRRATEKRDELAPFQWPNISRASNGTLLHLGGCCTAGFLFGV
jgi:hypothetical protein